MPLLTLVRHAKSSWADDALSDFERPLNPRGRRDAPRMARRLLEAGLKPDRLVSSPALRAITTASLFAKTFGIADTGIVADPRIYEASLATLLIVVAGLDPAATSVMLFGHNPGLSELAAHLSDGPYRDLPTCAAATIAFSGSGWTSKLRGPGKLLALRTPKDGEPRGPAR